MLSSNSIRCLSSIFIFADSLPCMRNSGQLPPRQYNREKRQGGVIRRVSCFILTATHILHGTYVRIKSIEESRIAGHWYWYPRDREQWWDDWRRLIVWQWRRIDLYLEEIIGSHRVHTIDSSVRLLSLTQEFRTLGVNRFWDGIHGDRHW